MSRTNNDSQKTTSITRNFRHKKWMSAYSVESIAHERVVKYNIGKNPVERAEGALEWVRELSRKTQEAMASIAIARAKGETPDSYAVESARLKVLHHLDWEYVGNYHDEKYAKSYPELSFHISTIQIGADLWYKASYGMAGESNSNSHKHGTYSLFLTLDEALAFFSDEVFYTGSRELSNHYQVDRLMKEAVNLGKEMDKMTREEKEKVIKDNRNTIVNTLKKYISDNNINNKHHTVRRSVDITALYELTTSKLIPLAQHQLTVSQEHEERAKRARAIKDAEGQSLESPRASLDPSGSLISPNGSRLEPLPAPSLFSNRTDSNTNDMLSDILSSEPEESTLDQPGAPVDTPVAEDVHFDEPAEVSLDEPAEVSLDEPSEQSLDNADSVEETKVIDTVQVPEDAPTEDVPEVEETEVIDTVQVPLNLSDHTPHTLCVLYNEGGIDRDELITILSEWDYVVDEDNDKDDTISQYDDLRVTTPGSIGEIVDASYSGLIDDALLDEVLKNIHGDDQEEISHEDSDNSKEIQESEVIEDTHEDNADNRQEVETTDGSSDIEHDDLLGQFSEMFPEVSDPARFPWTDETDDKNAR